jgi:xylulokinase
MSVLGIDIGTSGCKASVVDEAGRVIGQACRGYSLSSPAKGMEEIDPASVWDSVREVVGRAAHAASQAGASSPRAISVSSFGEAVVPVRADGAPLRNAILYIDPRGTVEARSLGERLGPERVHEISGASLHSMYSVHKIGWIKDHEPEVYRDAAAFLPLAEFALARLGARFHTDYSLAARTQAFDVTAKAWSTEILGAAEVDGEKLGEPVQSGAVVGELGGELAEELGLERGALLVAGGHDQPCAALGAGVVGPGAAVDGLGSTECVTPAFDRPVINAAMAASGFACVPHVVPGLYVSYAFTFTCGAALKWFRDRLAPWREGEASARGQDLFDLLIDEAAGEGTDLLFLPHLAGAATPYMDSLSRGALVGLGLETTGRDIVRAILEGVTYEIMVNVERLAEAGIEVQELRAVGGMAKSEAYLQLKADMMGRPIGTLESAEAGTLGVAMLAGLASGLYPDLSTAVARTVRRGRVFEPDPAAHSRFQERFDAYKKLYPAVRGILGRE